jgi:diadenosine tetraphosphate (Ap4A) HIT family hydrolase
MFEPITIRRRINTLCPFCNVNDVWMGRRIFYRDKNWFAVLAAPFHTKGHTILAALSKDYKCPKEFSEEVLAGLSTPIVKTIKIMKKCYTPKDVLLSSLRGSESHFHFHLVPLWEHEEKEWRDEQKDRRQYKNGHLMEFLGYLEKRANERDEIQKKEEGLTDEEHRDRIIVSLDPEVKKLRTMAKLLVDS